MEKGWAKEAELFEQIPKPPDGSDFYLIEVKRITIPHPFMITPMHVSYASDRHGGMLTDEAIRHSGAKCGWKACNLTYDAHETSMTLFIAVKQNKDLNAIDGLVAYLNSIKAKAEELGIKGFAFPVKN